MNRLQKAFTLAEVLITLAIIGVVAALSIPAVISNSQQQEFKTGLRKAVSVLNSAITMNMALDGESPYDNANTFGYLQKHMSILKSSTQLDYYCLAKRASGKLSGGNENNAVFYTTDGMRFEFNMASSGESKEAVKLHESDVYACDGTHPSLIGNESLHCNGCGAYGLNNNSDNTTKPPCLILVDVNGDKKPTPTNINCQSYSCQAQNLYVVPLPNEKKVRDIFPILITDKKAIPFGTTAQKAMYRAQK